MRASAVIALLLTLLLSSYSRAQRVPSNPSASEPPFIDGQDRNFGESVVPITSLALRGPMLQAHFGTGFCLDPECQFIGTNYHVAAMMDHLRIKGAKIVKRYLATGPSDDGAKLNYFAFGGAPLRFAPSRDLAVFELSRPLRNHHGLKFSTEDLEVGHAIDIYAYPKGAIDPFRSLQIFHGTFEGLTTTGLLAFDYAPNGGKRVRPGASGGIVVDSDTGKVVGIVSGIAANRQPIAVAVPVESLAEFLYKDLPFLAGALFPIRTNVPEEQSDAYPKYEPPANPRDLQRRPVEPNQVVELRKRAQALSEGMRNFIAVQTFVWGKVNHRPEAAEAYEVQVRDGVQMYREYPNGKNWTRRSPDPGLVTSISAGNTWSELPLFLGTHVGVKIHEAAGTEVEGRPMKVFQYLASLEDNPCLVDDAFYFGLFSIHVLHTYTAYGEVWTDGNLNIMRMSLHCEENGRHKWEDVMNFGWLTRPGVEPRLVPVTVVSWAPNRIKGVWCRSQFVDYREFASRARLLHQPVPADVVARSTSEPPSQRGPGGG
jgi:Trypsin-like peptidase domain